MISFKTVKKHSQSIAVIEKRAAITSKNSQTDIVIPTNWADFARLTTIRSGGHIIPFSPYDYQEQLVEMMLERSCIVVKSRQLGLSETIICYMLWRACLNPGYLGVVFSKTQMDTGLLARRMRRMIASIGLKTKTENYGDIEIEGHGRILFRNSKPESGRSLESVVDIFFDEAAFVDDFKAIFDAIAPAQQMVGESARVYVVSTPNGKSGYYWDLLTTGQSTDIEALCDRISAGNENPFISWVDSGGWAKVVVHWKAHPIYGSNPNFLKEIAEKQKLSAETIKQEYDLSFGSSEENYFDYSTVQACITDEEISKERNPDSVYVLGVDPAFGGDDYCAAVLLECSPSSDRFNVLVPYRKRQQTTEYNLLKISDVIKQYKPKLVVVEVNGGGVVYQEQLSRQIPYIRFMAMRTTGDSKPGLLSRVKLALEREVLQFSSGSAVADELLSFRSNGKKLEAAQGKHDDTVMALGFAIAGLEELSLI